MGKIKIHKNEMCLNTRTRTHIHTNSIAAAEENLINSDEKRSEIGTNSKLKINFI